MEDGQSTYNGFVILESSTEVHAHIVCVREAVMVLVNMSLLHFLTCSLWYRITLQTHALERNFSGNVEIETVTMPWD